MIGRSVFVLIALTGVVFLQTPMGTRPHAPAATVMTHSEKQAAPPTQRSPQRSPQSGPRPARAVSVLELIANPSRYDGMRVEVVGVLSLYAPDNGLYAFQEAFEYATTDYVMMVLALESLGQFSHFHGRWVRVVGTFHLWKSGQEGSIDDVGSIVAAPKREVLFGPPIR